MRARGRTTKPWSRYGIGFLLAAIVIPARATSADLAPHQSTFGPGQASAAVRLLAAWIVARGDNRGLPILIVDKTAAEVFAIDPSGQLAGTAPVLLGLARGDDSPAGIGDRKLAAIPPGDRITPAGRFAAVLGENLGAKTVLWVDYNAALSLHPVITTKPAERRLERLATRTPADNRISYGCINVPAQFFNGIVRPLFKTSGGFVYILPEVRSIDSVFFKRPVFAVGQAETALVMTRRVNDAAGGER